MPHSLALKRNRILIHWWDCENFPPAARFRWRSSYSFAIVLARCSRLQASNAWEAALSMSAANDFDEASRGWTHLTINFLRSLSRRRRSSLKRLRDVSATLRLWCRTSCCVLWCWLDTRTDATRHNGCEAAPWKYFRSGYNRFWYWDIFWYFGSCVSLTPEL